MSIHWIFSLLAQWPNLLRSATAFLVPVINLTVNPSKRCFPGRNFPPEHAYITSAADEFTKCSLRADKPEEFLPYKVVKNYFREFGSSTSPANTFCAFRGSSRGFGWMLSISFLSFIAHPQILLSAIWLCCFAMLRAEEYVRSPCHTIIFLVNSAWIFNSDSSNCFLNFFARVIPDHSSL